MPFSPERRIARLSRRDFLHLTGLVFTALILEACKGEVPSFRQDNVASPTPEFSPTAAPTVIPTFTPRIETPTPEIQKYIVQGIDKGYESLEFIPDKFPILFPDDKYYLWYLLNSIKLFDPYHIPSGVELIVPDRIIDPPILPEIVLSPENWEYSLAEHKTSLKGSSQRRLKNIEQGVNNLNGKFILPYRLFSMKNAIGPIDEKHGFVMCSGYLGGQEVPMMGGGICQIPSTVFKPVLESGLLVVERMAHEFYWDNYEPYDATISDTFDLTFRNLCDFPMQIRVFIDGDDLKVSIWSPKPLSYREIKVEITLNEIDEKEWKDNKRHSSVQQTVVNQDGRIRVRTYDSQYLPKKKSG